MIGPPGSSGVSDRVGPDINPDRYVLGPAVASGAEGILYRGTITTGSGVELTVAIKMLQPGLLPHVEEWHDRWSEQVELVRSLHFPGVVAVRDGFLGPLPHPPGAPGQGRTLYLVMNWVDGDPLDGWVRHRPDRDPIDALKVLLPVAAALDIMHLGTATGGVPVLHRDVKPSNILVANDVTVLVDFGLTRGLPAGSRQSERVGTRGYMAPEIDDAGIYSTASDRYAFAGVVFFVLTGNEPPTSHQSGVLRAALASVPALDTRPEAIDHVLEMFSEEPEHRPEGLANWVGQLRRSSLGGMPPVLPPPAPRRNPPPPQKAVPIPVPTGPDFDPPDTPVAPAPVVPAVRAQPVRPQPAPQRRRRGRRVLLAVAVAVLGIVGVVAAMWPPPPSTPTILLGNYVGALQYEAQYNLVVQGFHPVPDPQYDDAEAGHVTAQSPAGGRWKKGTTVTLTVSKGPPIVPVPDLSGKTQEQTFEALSTAGFKVGTVSSQADDRVRNGVIVDWTLKGTEAPKGTAIGLVFSTGPPVGPPVPSVLGRGTLAAKSYVTNKFRPTLTFSVKEGWQATLESADHVTLTRTGDPQGRRVDVMRVQRVYDRRPFSTVDEALNSVTAFYGSVSQWLGSGAAEKHGSVKAGPSTPVARIDGANEEGQRVDATFVPYTYEGCPTQSPACVLLFQLDPFPPEKSETYAYIARQGEKTRFQIFDVGRAKVIVALTAQEGDFDTFVSEVSAGSFAIAKFGDDARITRTSLEVVPKAGNEPVVVATVMVDGEKCRPRDGSTVSIFTQSVAPENRLSERLPIQGGKVVRQISLLGPGPHRIIVMYDGDPNCDSSVSAPVVTPR